MNSITKGMRTMPKTKPAPKLSPLSTTEAKSALRGAGLRSTAARIAILQCLAEEKGPLTHAEVTERLIDLGIDQSTIYRCLTELAEAGLLARLDLGDAVRRFEIIGKELTGVAEHPHFLCVDCGKIQCLSDFSIRLSSRRSGAVSPGQITEVLVKGHCTNCA